MAVTDAKFGFMYPAAADVPQIHRDKSVRCIIDVENTGNVTIPDGALWLYYDCALDLSSISGRTCDDMNTIWINEADVNLYKDNDTDIAPNGTYTFSFTTAASNLPIGLIDAGFSIVLYIEGREDLDTYPDCLLKKDAFEVVER